MYNIGSCKVVQTLYKKLVFEVIAMTLISIKDYAQSKGVSYEAVRQQVVRFRAELGPHIVKKGKTQFLDDDAVAYLDARRQDNPVVIYEKNKDEELERLAAENKSLLVELASVQKQLLQVMPQIAQAEQAQRLLDAQQAESAAQQAQIQTQQERIAQLESDVQAAALARAQAEDQLAQIKARGFFARLLNR